MPRVTISEAARRCGISRQSIHRYLNRGKLRRFADGTVDTADLAHLGLSVVTEVTPVTGSERDTVFSPVTPAVTPVIPTATAPPGRLELDYRERYIALLEQQVGRLQQDLNTAREEVRQQREALHHRDTLLVQMLQDTRQALQDAQQVQRQLLHTGGQVHTPGQRHAMRQQIVTLLQIHGALSHQALQDLLQVSKDLGPTLRAMHRDGLLTRVRPGVYGLGDITAAPP